jgi:hypothetical protein
MPTQDEAAQQLRDANQELMKVATETQGLLDKITALEQAATNTDVQPALQEAIDAVVAQAKVVDDLVPDTVAAKRKKK